MSKTLIDAWLSARTDAFRTAGVTLSVSDFGSRGAYLDIETRSKLARLVMWPSGRAELEVVSIDTGERAYFKETDDFSIEIMEAWWSALEGE